MIIFFTFILCISEEGLDPSPFVSVGGAGEGEDENDLGSFSELHAFTAEHLCTCQDVTAERAHAVWINHQIILKCPSPLVEKPGTI